MPTKHARELSGLVLAQMPIAEAPEGTQAAPGDLAEKLRKALPHILTGLMELGEIAKDGQVSPDEIGKIAVKVFGFLQGFRAAKGG